MDTNPDRMRSLVDRAVAGDRGALEAIVVALKDDLYKLSLRMLGSPAEAEDATQEILIQVVTHLAQWRGDASLRTWAWRIASRHLMRMKRGQVEDTVTLELAERMIAKGEANPPLPDLGEAELQRLEAELRASCTQAMLTSLDRDQRISFVLAEIFELDSQQASEVLDVDPATHRKRLSRARERLGTWMSANCGVVAPRNPCRCRRQIPVAIEAGFVNPAQLVFATHPVQQRSRALPVLDAATEVELAAQTICGHRDYAAPDMLIARIRALLDAGTIRLLS